MQVTVYDLEPSWTFLSQRGWPWFRFKPRWCWNQPALGTSEASDLQPFADLLFCPRRTFGFPRARGYLENAECSHLSHERTLALLLLACSPSSRTSASLLQHRQTPGLLLPPTDPATGTAAAAIPLCLGEELPCLPVNSASRQLRGLQLGRTQLWDTLQALLDCLV